MRSTLVVRLCILIIPILSVGMAEVAVLSFLNHARKMGKKKVSNTNGFWDFPCNSLANIETWNFQFFFFFNFVGISRHG